MLRRRRFYDLVERQLDLLASDDAPLLEEVREADAAWKNAGAEDSEELYGDYQLVVDAIGERLHDIRETYAARLDGRAADDYRATFNRAAGKRFRRFAGLLEDE
jgi:hypothetical protein